MSRPVGYSRYQARYAKGMVALHIPSDDGWKNFRHALIETLHPRWSNRERAYILSPAKADRFEALCRAKESAVQNLDSPGLCD